MASATGPRRGDERVATPATISARWRRGSGRRRVVGRTRLAPRELPQRRAIPTQLGECPPRLFLGQRAAIQTPVGPERLHDLVEVVGQAKDTARRQEGSALLEVP